MDGHSPLQLPNSRIAALIFHDLLGLQELVETKCRFIVTLPYHELKEIRLRAVAPDDVCFGTHQRRARRACDRLT